MIIIEQHTVQSLSTPARLYDVIPDLFTSLPSRKAVKKQLKKKAFLLNNVIGQSGDWVSNGDVIQYIEVEITPPKPYELYYDVLFEDEYMSIINKPAGIVVSGNKYRTIVNTLSFNLKKSGHPDALNWPRPVHRLDEPTSGLLVVAKTYQALRTLSDQFEKRTVSKYYEAIIIGTIPEEGHIDLEIDNKKAITRFTRLHAVKSLKSGNLSHVQLKPETGRKHQLRKHMAAQGTPILGDSLYGKEGLILQKKGLFLCATAIELVHPIHKKEIKISIDTPYKFTARLQQEQRRWLKYQSKGF